MYQTPTERRANPRYPLRAELTFTYAGQTFTGHCHDLSKSGLSFETEAELPAGETLPFTLRLTVASAQARLTVRGTIRWRQSSEASLLRYGVLFGAMNTAQLNVLGEFLGGTGLPPMANPPPSA
jgi:hypothetical protein